MLSIIGNFRWLVWFLPDSIWCPRQNIISTKNKRIFKVCQTSIKQAAISVYNSTQNPIIWIINRITVKNSLQYQRKILHKMSGYNWIKCGILIYQYTFNSSSFSLISINPRCSLPPKWSASRLSLSWRPK